MRLEVNKRRKGEFVVGCQDEMMLGMHISLYIVHV